MPKDEKDKKVKTFKEWLEEQEHVSVLGDELYYRFKGQKDDFMVNVKDVPETLQLGDKVKYIETEEGDALDLATLVAEFYGLSEEEALELVETTSLLEDENTEE